MKRQQRKKTVNENDTLPTPMKQQNDSQQLSSGGRRVIEILITEKVGFQRSKSTNTNFHSKIPIFINQSQYGIT